MSPDPLTMDPHGGLPRGPLVLAMLVLSASLAGCADTGPADDGEASGSDEGIRLYEHRWTYGPATYGDELPRFEDAFEVPPDVSNLTVSIDWSIEDGRAAVVLDPPGGDREVNLTDRNHGGPRGSGNASLQAAEGDWGFAIPTWRGQDGRFPSGNVRVVVTGR